MRTTIFFLFLCYVLNVLAQDSLYSEANPSGEWYTDESRDAAWESGVSALHKIWILEPCENKVNGIHRISAITLKPGNVGTVISSEKVQINETSFMSTISVIMPITYSKTKDKLTFKTNPLKATIVVKPEVTNLSQRVKDIIAKSKSKAFTKIRQNKPTIENYVIVRLDDYLVIKDTKLGFPSLFVSEELQKQAEARKETQDQAEAERRAKLFDLQNDVKIVYYGNGMEITHLQTKIYHLASKPWTDINFSILISEAGFKEMEM